MGLEARKQERKTLMSVVKSMTILRSNIASISSKQIEKIEVDFREGIRFSLSNYGAIIQSLEVPDKKGVRQNVVLSYNDFKSYFNDDQYIGCLVGRCANRINNGQFFIDDCAYQLTRNHGKNHLHGGINGFGKVVWSIDRIKEHKDHVQLTLSYDSADGEEGYPGNLNVSINYRIYRSEINISIRAVTDKKTHFNPTYHPYFNLSGDFNRSIDDHLLQIDASRVVEVDHSLIPTGRINDIAGSDGDFGMQTPIGKKTYDACYLIEGTANLSHPGSGRSIKLETTAPGVQLYTGDYLKEPHFSSRSGVCLEPQFLPDTPNQKSFPSSLLDIGEIFKFEMRFSFFWN